MILMGSSSVLMQWAEGGRYLQPFSLVSEYLDISTHQYTRSLDDFIDARLGLPASQEEYDPSEKDPTSRSARIRAFKQNRTQQKPLRSHSGLGLKPVHLFSADEIHSLFSDITQGLAFLVSSSVHVVSCTSLMTTFSQHDKSILHLDLKPGNVLLTWDQGRLMSVSHTFAARVSKLTHI